MRAGPQLDSPAVMRRITPVMTIAMIGTPPRVSRKATICSLYWRSYSQWPQRSEGIDAASSYRP